MASINYRSTAGNSAVTDKPNPVLLQAEEEMGR